MRQSSDGLWEVRFQSGETKYRYRDSDVVVLTESEWHDPQYCRVYGRNGVMNNVIGVYSFRQGAQTHWRIECDKGFVGDYLDGKIMVVESCLAGEAAQNVFGYLKNIATVNNLGRDEEHGGILASIYNRLDFIEDSLAAAPYINPECYGIKHISYSATGLIFPFGCNASQEKAVTAAFENHISVIQGPPGTGKTQTILNIIANIVVQGKTVMVVSNNNSATQNVLDKLQKEGLGFIVAPLGSRENKERFILNQPSLPAELQQWRIDDADIVQSKEQLKQVRTLLREGFELQEEYATAKHRIADVELEFQHFLLTRRYYTTDCEPKKGVKSERFLDLWMRFQRYVDEAGSLFALFRIVERWRWKCFNIMRKMVWGIDSSFEVESASAVIEELQYLYYKSSIAELHTHISRIGARLAELDVVALSDRLKTLSVSIFKNSLHGRYAKVSREVLTDVKDLNTRADILREQYPVVLSTTFSARPSLLGNKAYDYIIMDEASQVSVETGALALTCAKNAVIVGDSMQLPNVITDEDRAKLSAIFDAYRINRGYHCAEHSFLHSICTIIPEVPQTLLREHYRCHPRIINFCNQRFYGGKLVIMTKDAGEADVMRVVKTVPGQHSRGHYNQREIDVVKQEVMPNLPENADIGVVTPYNIQVSQFRQQLPTVEAATIHKYQGREKEHIIMSVVDDQLTEFVDDPNMLNVAVSRAQKSFCLVVSGNEQERKGYIGDLIDYVKYNNLEVSESKICSIFDYLYSQYAEKRHELLSNHKGISAYDSENLTYSLLETILAEHVEFSHLGVFCHIPLAQIIRDYSFLSSNEARFVAHPNAHVDFLLANRVTKHPVMAVETDGYSYHKEGTEQHRRDQMKNAILKRYGLPLVRLSTTGSGERARIVEALRGILPA